MSLLSGKDAKKAWELLLKEYPDAGCELDFDSAFHLLVSVVLSAQTTDKAVNKVTPALFAMAPDAFAMASLPAEKIEECIRSIGLYRTKAANLKKLSAALCEEHGGEVPSEYGELVALPGVGRKTANVVLAEAFGQQRIAGDTHVCRLANRIGFVGEDDVVKTEEALMKLFPKDIWRRMHHALIWHGRRVCHAKNPDCDDCCLAGLCKHN
jgi:endonuclease-3